MPGLIGDTLLSATRQRLFDLAYAEATLTKVGSAPESSYALGGRLRLAKSGWLLLDVPNAIVQGLFQALHEPGVELPPAHGNSTYNAHISVMTKDEVARVGADNINERGKTFRFQLGPLQHVAPQNWADISRVWFVQVQSPELKKLRASYGLSSLPHDTHEFHISVAVRRKSIFQNNGISKAADSGEPAPSKSLPAESSPLTDPALRTPRIPEVKAPRIAPLKSGPVPPSSPTIAQFAARQNTRRNMPTVLATRPDAPPLMGRLPFPAGSQVPALNQVLDTLSQDPPAAAALEHSIHGVHPRGQLIAQAIEKGFRPLPATRVSPTAAQLYERKYTQQPKLTVDSAAQPHYNSDTGRLVVTPLRSAAGLEGLAYHPMRYLDPGVVAIHETEHALTVPTNAQLATAGRHWTRSAIGPEIPPSLGDLVNQAEVVKRDAGITLNDPIELASGLNANPEWMRQQAQEHGYFDGKSMTELLATPPGKQWLTQQLQKLRDAQNYTAEGAGGGYRVQGNLLPPPANSVKTNTNSVPVPVTSEKSSGYVKNANFEYRTPQHKNKFLARSRVTSCNDSVAYKYADDTTAQILKDWVPNPDSAYKGIQGFARVYKPPGMVLSALQQARNVTENLPQIAFSAYKQLPGFHLPEAVAGGVVGGLGGLVTDAVRGGANLSLAQRRKRRLKSVLYGAGAGAAVANVVGDRARRYATNVLVPAGYNNSPLEQLKPTWKKVIDGAILDKPAFDPAGLTKAMGPTFNENFYKMLLARRELSRIDFGVHTPDPTTDFWTHNSDNTYSINPHGPNKEFMLNFGVTQNNHPEFQQLLTDPEAKLKSLGTKEQGDAPWAPLMGGLAMGGHEVPFRKNTDGSLSAMTLDRWDMTHDPPERKWMVSNLWKYITDPEWRNAPFVDPISTWHNSNKVLGNQRKNSDVMSQLLARQVWDLAGKHPWVKQMYTLKPQSDPTQAPYELQAYNHDGSLLGAPMRVPRPAPSPPVASR
jgi:hypothetical protein